MAPDLPNPHDAENLVIEFDSHEFVFFPLTSPYRRGGLRNTPTHCADHRHRVLGSCDSIATRRIHHHDSTTRCCRSIDIVQSRPGPPDHFQFPCCRNQFLRHLGAGTHDQSIGVLNLLEQLFLRHLGLHDRSEPCLFQQLHALPGQTIADENFHALCACPTP